MDKLRCLRTVGAVATVAFLISCGRNDTMPETTPPLASPGATATPGLTISPTPAPSLTPAPAIPGQSSGTATTP